MENDQGSKNVRSEIIGSSPKFIEALQIAKKAAQSKANIFIYGESGSGKEIFAKFIHQESQNFKGHLVAINCSAIPENLLESELFGHAKGSFTGAYDKKVGLFEEAQDGTLFLDEVGDLSLPLQAKLLRVLQEKKIKRVGENIYRPINCRIISATHKDLAEAVNNKSFREDLYFRLNVIPIHIPPLRERKEDIKPLADAFLKKFIIENKEKYKYFSEPVIEFIENHNWRGNVRELENSVERAVAMCPDSEIRLENFNFSNSSLLNKQIKLENQISDDFNIPYGNKLLSLEHIIHRYIEYAVHKNHGAKDKTAREIGIDRKTLYKKMRPEIFLN